jgi:hypothetical protein
VIPTYDERSLRCIEQVFHPLGLDVKLERWFCGDATTPELVVIVRGSCDLGTDVLNDRGMEAFEAEFSDREPWPLLAILTTGAPGVEQANGRGTRKEAS